MAINKTVRNGAVVLEENSKDLMILSASVKGDTIVVDLEGNLRSDADSYLHNELQFYLCSGMKALEFHLEKTTAISKSCFKELLDMKIDMLHQGGSAVFLDKPSCVLELEKKTGQIL